MFIMHFLVYSMNWTPEKSSIFLVERIGLHHFGFWSAWYFVNLTMSLIFVLSVVGISIAWIRAICTISLVLIPHASVGAMPSMENWDMALMARSLFHLRFCFLFNTNTFNINISLFWSYLFFSFYCDVFTLLCSILLDRSSAVPKKVDILEGMHVIV